MQLHVGVSRNQGTFWRVPVIRSLVCWGLYWDPPIYGKYRVTLDLAAGLMLDRAPSLHRAVLATIDAKEFARP